MSMFTFSKRSDAWTEAKLVLINSPESVSPVLIAAAVVMRRVDVRSFPYTWIPFTMGGSGMEGELFSEDA